MYFCMELSVIAVCTARSCFGSRAYIYKITTHLRKKYRKTHFNSDVNIPQQATTISFVLLQFEKTNPKKSIIDMPFQKMLVRYYKNPYTPCLIKIKEAK